MKTKIAFTLVGTALIFSILACSVTIFGNEIGESVRGSGVKVEQNRDLGNISAVELTMEGTLHIVRGGGEALRIEAEDNLLEYIQTDVRAGRLVIETRQGIELDPTQPINYYLTVDELDTIAVSSSGDVEAADLQSETFEARISSSGDITIASLDCTTLRVDISSSGSLEILGGQAQRQNIEISSSGGYSAGELASAEADVDLTSSGSATIRVSERLSGELSSSGSLYYIGNPDVNVRTTSSGRTEQIEK